MKILAIESSCDETSAAVIENTAVKSNIISSQTFHSKFGGVVPELASRAHLENISEIVDRALSESDTDITDIDAIAVTKEPGLMGALIVGSSFAKGLSIKYDIPIIPVNHIEGHLYSGNLEDPTLEFPFIALVVSGGHTALFKVDSFEEYKIIGLTKDDAAGEAFDKIAKLMGLPYPGGPVIDKLAKEGKDIYDFPRSMINSGDLDFSFSGLKTSVRYFIQKNFKDGIPEEKLPDLAASVQSAIVDVLVKKLIKATKIYKIRTIVIGGGVSANSQLRAELDNLKKNNYNVVIPSMEYCVDNAAMIGFLAEKKYSLSENTDKYFDLSFNVSSKPIR